ncbi:siderophore-interacting protein [Arthrobacter crusticola]|uniref:Siderophore-interacting protein n=1 Tax=Arthrobacter crusticola TaxID=2547960 RepID=A0A4R5TWB4_9MICC|nr:siderophore-interacting protein [Arthrobacter crusticola]TDK25378.1 siderophore-interacting protein [Arthrobacter crusticola]
MTETTRRAARPAPPAPPVLAFDVEVKKVERIGANFQRITFGGDSLRDFGVNGPTCDLRIKVIIPPPGGSTVDLSGELRRGDGDGWYQRWLGLDPAERGVMRTYTVRASRCQGPSPEIDVDFVLHFDADGSAGPAALWAAGAAPGATLCLIGPNAAAARCATAGAYGGIEWRPGLAGSVLLAGDETAVPAISAILESLPPELGGQAFLEVADAADIQPLETPSSVEATWLVRGRQEHGALLNQAVRRALPPPGWAVLAGSAPDRQGAPGPEPEEVDVDRTILWETPQALSAAASSTAERPPGSQPFYAWIAGEASTVRELRRYLVRDVGIDRKQVAFMGYWRRGRAESA